MSVTTPTENVSFPGSEPAAGAAGLVTSAITRRVTPDAPSGVFDAVDASLAWAPKFPAPEVVQAAASSFLGSSPARGPVAPWDGRSRGKRPRIVVTPGALQLTAPDPGRALARAEFLADKHAKWVDLDASTHDPDPEGGTFLSDGGLIGSSPAAQITGWSRRSRSRMIHRLAELDYTPMAELEGVPAMITLTYPDRWEDVAPSGRDVKRHMDKLRKRFARAWDVELVCAWKLEFQRRGAPHLHLMMVPPRGAAGQRRDAAHEVKLAAWQRDKDSGASPGPRPRNRPGHADGLRFGGWLSQNWADIVGASDEIDRWPAGGSPSSERFRHIMAGTAIDFAEGMKAFDPKSLAVYFSKHGLFSAKEYQHEVPELWQEPGRGPGRFWGYWGLRPLRAAAELTLAEYQLIARTLRKRASRSRVWDPATGSYVWVKSMQKRAVRRHRIVRRTPTAVEPFPLALVVRLRTVRVPVRRFTHTSGYVCINDAPGVARDLARVQALCVPDAVPSARRRRLSELRASRELDNGPRV